MNGHFHLFVYGTLRSNGAGAALLSSGELIGEGSVGGVLYDMDGRYPALLLYGNTPVRGEVWRMPVSALQALDEYEGVAEGLFRRIGVEVSLDEGGVQGCWVYVAGPALARALTGDRQISSSHRGTD